MKWSVKSKGQKAPGNRDRRKRIMRTSSFKRGSGMATPPDAASSSFALYPSLFTLRSLLFTLHSLLFFAVPLRAGGPGSASVQILKTDMSPRAMAMAGSFAAVADDVYAAHYNPAGLGLLDAPAASAMYLSGFEDSRLQYFTLGMPVPVPGLAGLEKPGMSLSAVFTQNGLFTRRDLNPDGTVTTREMDAESNRIVSVSYGEKALVSDVMIDKYKARFEHFLGGSVKYIGSTLLDEYTASALALDAGWLVRETNSGLGFGVALSNYGTGLKYLKEQNPLPSIMRVGLSYFRPTIKEQSVLLTLEGDFYTAESLSNLRAGLEYHLEHIFNFRFGYKARDDNKGPAMGVGAHHGGFAIDFAVTMGNAVFNTTQVAFTYKFADRPSAAAKRPADSGLDEDYSLVERTPERKGKKKPAAKTPARKKSPPRKPAGGNDQFYWIN